MTLPQPDDGCPECGQPFESRTTLKIGGARGKVPAVPRDVVTCPNGHEFWADPEGLTPKPV